MNFPSASGGELFCPGFYCGKIDVNGSGIVCGSCPRGSRADDSQACSQCLNSPSFYDFTYLTFMVLIFLIIQFYFVDKLVRTSRVSSSTIILYILVAFECILAAGITLLLFEPQYEFGLRSCNVRHISDWYTLFFNPTTVESLNCTQEAVYPLYSIVFVFYFVSLLLVVFRHVYLRAILLILLTVTHCAKVKSIYTVLYQKNFVTNVMYYTLYSIPVVLFVHSIFAGIIYYIFPYLITVGSVLSMANHLSHHIDQSTRYLVRASFRTRNLFIVLFHWALHAFGIVSLTGLKSSECFLYFLLIPTPMLFYIATAKFTHPDALFLEPFEFDI